MTRTNLLFLDLPKTVEEKRLVKEWAITYYYFIRQLACFTLRRRYWQWRCDRSTPITLFDLKINYWFWGEGANRERCDPPIGRDLCHLHRKSVNAKWCDCELAKAFFNVNIACLNRRGPTVDDAMLQQIVSCSNRRLMLQGTCWQWPVWSEISKCLVDLWLCWRNTCLQKKIHIINRRFDPDMNLGEVEGKYGDGGRCHRTIDCEFSIHLGRVSRGTRWR